MAKIFHEIRDPIHTFIQLVSDERRAVDSEPVQRLRYIHQLAMTYLVYPGATHRRLEHSLGVMELAGRVFDVVTDENHIHPTVRQILSVELTDRSRKDYWRRVVRMAALCHDLGHPPFSHAGEGLFPTGRTHEQLSAEIIRSPQMEDAWHAMRPVPDAGDLAKVAVGPEKLTGLDFGQWELIVSEIVTGDAFGADRIDYLLRDSLHAGVAYGRFDHFRLIDTLRILPAPPTADEPEGTREPQLGIEWGGLQSAEALLLARYFMFSQVYFHPVRRIYDIHLKDFLQQWLPGGKFPVNIRKHLELTDNEVLAGMARAARRSGLPGHEPAWRILRRKHFKVLWNWNPADFQRNSDAGALIFEAVKGKFGADSVRRDNYSARAPEVDFPVLQRDGTIASAQSLSQVLANIPPGTFDYVFVEPDFVDEARRWLDQNRDEILKPVAVED